MPHPLTIGKLAKRADVSIDSIRFYERRGLIAEPVRTDSNYRIYRREVATQLRFIKRAQQLGFSLAEVKELLALRQDPHATKADVKQKTEEKIADIRSRIEDLTRMLKALEQLDASCDGCGPTSECPILKSLAKGDMGMTSGDKGSMS